MTHNRHCTGKHPPVPAVKAVDSPLGDCRRRLLSLPFCDPEISLNRTHHLPTSHRNPSLAVVPCQPSSVRPTPPILRLIVVSLSSPPLGVAVPVAVAIAYTVAVPVLVAGDNPPYNNNDNEDDGVLRTMTHCHHRPIRSPLRPTLPPPLCHPLHQTCCCAAVDDATLAAAAALPPANAIAALTAASVVAAPPLTSCCHCCCRCRCAAALTPPPLPH